MNLTELFSKTASEDGAQAGGSVRQVSPEEYRKTALPGDETSYSPPPNGAPDETSYTHEEGVHRGVNVVLPQHIHDFVHDPNQPAPAKAHLLLSEVRKQNAKNQGPEGEEGSTGGLGNYWSPSPHKAAAYTTQAGWDAYRSHEREHNCGDEASGMNGCPTTHVVIHAKTPKDEDHWTEQFRDGERYDPAISWRLPVRPGAKMDVTGVSWRPGDDHLPYSDGRISYHTQTPFSRYDFAEPVTKEAVNIVQVRRLIELKRQQFGSCRENTMCQAWNGHRGNCWYGGWGGTGAWGPGAGGFGPAGDSGAGGDVGGEDSGGGDGGMGAEASLTDRWAALSEEEPEISMEPGSTVCPAMSRTAEADAVTQKAMDEASQSWHTNLHYDAENIWSGKTKQRQYPSLRHAQDHADEIADKEGVPRVLVGRNSHGSDWSFYTQSHSANLGGPVVALGSNHLHEAKLIHEMAHHVHTAKGKPEEDAHGDGFTSRYIDMLRTHHSGGAQASFGFVQSLQSVHHQMVHGGPYERSHTFGKPFPPVPDSKKPYVAPPPPPDETGDLHSGYTWRQPPDKQNGGTKYPYKAQVIAEHPEHGEVGRLTYFPPRRKGGIVRIDNVDVSSDHQRQGLASALMDHVQTRHPGSRIDYGGKGNLNDDGAAWLKGYQKGKKVVRGRTMEAGMSARQAALDPVNKPHQATTSYAQQLARKEQPEISQPLPYSEKKASQRLQDVLRAHGHPQADTAFVMQQEHGRRQSQVVFDGDTGDVGVALHKDRYDYGTLAHEAGHIIDAHRNGKDLLESLSDAETHGESFRAAYHDALHHLVGVDAANAFTRNYRKHLRIMKESPEKYQVKQAEAGANGSLPTGVDNSNIGDHPVYTQDHTWLPEGRYWGPNSAQNDQRLFEGDHLRPEVREDILSRINSFMRPRYKEWPSWTKVYFAGSEAARWAPFNGDFDVLLGADFDKFRAANPDFDDQPDENIAKTITDGMWRTINVDGYWFTLKDGRKVGPFDRTFFMNPQAWDIRKLKPYAAYDVTDDTWAVHPLEVPKDWSAKSLPESYWTYAEAILNEVKAIGTLPPEERHRMAANLWEEIHTHRSDAFGENGKGLYDLSNVIEKFLDQSPEKPWAKLVQWKNESPSGPSPWVPTTARRTTLTSLFSTSKTKQAPEGADYDGIMIAIVPPKSVGRKLLVEGGEPLEALHVTLAYLGSSGEHTKAQMASLPSLVEAWARTQKPFEAKVAGAGTFVNPGSHVLMAHVDIPGGGGVRHSLDELLQEHDYKVRNDHGWTPHITLKYHTSHVRFLPKVEPATWDVKEIMLCIGGTWTPIRLGG